MAVKKRYYEKRTPRKEKSDGKKSCGEEIIYREEKNYHQKASCNASS